MKELSREEKLRQLISEMEDACEKKKRLRVKRTFFVLSGVIYLATFMYGEISDIKELLYMLIGVPVAAALIMLISLLVLLYISAGATEDEKYIAKLQGELNAIKFNKYE